jgi:anti-sigma B factor antagonist
VSALSLGTRREAGRTVVSLTGDLDLATVPTLREAALAELTAADCKILVLDLNGLVFVDSTGLGCWIDLRNHAAANGSELALANVPAVARRTIAVAGLADVFGVAPDTGRVATPYARVELSGEAGTGPDDIPREAPAGGPDETSAT